ncbi:MAG: tetratricopeptide repeat protein [Bryobacterales bacterium]|nr:tetratricopeptide repeat protein [Bryobacterales bacterium]
MAIVVLTRAVIVPVEVLKRKWPGGEASYRAAAPNKTYRCDGHLAAVEFMTPGDVECWIEQTLKPAGLRFPEMGAERDVVVADSYEGLTTPCNWLDFRRLNHWSEARLKGAPETQLTGPPGWSPEAEPDTHYVAPDACGRRMKFLSVDDAVATFLDEETGRRNYIGMVNRDSLQLILGWRLQAIWDRFSPMRALADRDPNGLPEEGRARLREAALECERIAQVAEPLESKVLWLAGLLSRIAQEWKLSARLWRLYLAGELGDAGGWMELTWCLGELGEKEEALVAAKRAVEIEPDNPGAAANMAASLRALGRRNEALEWVDKALALDPDDRVSQMLRAELLQRTSPEG